MMSGTPRTDDCEGSASDHLDCMALTDHARQLERELAEAQAEIVRLKGEAESWEKVFDRTVGLLLIMPQFSNIHPDDMLEAILKETRERK